MAPTAVAELPAGKVDVSTPERAATPSESVVGGADGGVPPRVADDLAGHARSGPVAASVALSVPVSSRSRRHRPLP